MTSLRPNMYVPNSYMAWIKPALINILLTAISVGVALICAEFVLRHTLYANLLRPSQVPPAYYQADPAGYDIRKDFATTTHIFSDGEYPFWSNDLGCFDDQYSGEMPYSLLVGDSFAWGFAPFETKWGTILENELGKRIVKCGVSGYGTMQEYMKAQKVLAQLPHPETIIVAYFANDVGDDAAFARAELTHLSTTTVEKQSETLATNQRLLETYCMTTIPAHPLLQRAKCFLRSRSMLYLFAQSTIKDMLPRKVLLMLGIADDSASIRILSASDIRHHMQNILRFKALAESEHADLLFVIIPTKEAANSPSLAELSTSPELPTIESRWFIPFFKAHGIDFIDPLADFLDVREKSGRSLYYPFDGHINEEGNRLLGLLTAYHILMKEGRGAELAEVEGLLKKEFSLYKQQN